MKIGFCICGSFCTHKKALCALEALAAEHEIVPVLSFCAAKTDTRFGAASELTAAVTRICGREPVTTLTGAEPLGPA